MARAVRLRRVVIGVAVPLALVPLTACGGSPFGQLREVALGPVQASATSSSGCTAPTRSAPSASLDGPLTDHSGDRITSAAAVSRTQLAFNHDIFLINGTTHPLVMDSVYLTGEPGVPTPVVVHEGILPTGGSELAGVPRLLAGTLARVHGYVVPAARPAGTPAPPHAMYATADPQLYLALRAPACAVDGPHPPGFAMNANVVLGYHLQGSSFELFAVLPFRSRLCIDGMAPHGCA